MRPRTKVSFKIDRFLLISVFIYLFARLLFLVISSTLSITPYICYDDKYIYSTLEKLDKLQIVNYTFSWRNNYYWLSSLLNDYTFSDYFSLARIVNCGLMFLTVLKFSRICEYLNTNNKVHRFFILLLCISPYYMIYSMVQLREVICLWSTVSLFILFFEYEKENRVNIVKVILYLFISFTTRTYVLEAFVFIFLFYKLRTSKWYYKVILLVLAIGVFTYFANDANYLYVLDNKMQNYVTAGNGAKGFLGSLSISGIKDIYKLLLLVPYIQITPLPGTFDSYYTWSSWGALLTLTSGIAAFVLPYFWFEAVNVIKNRKQDTYDIILLSFYFLFILIIAVTQPGNARFPFFVTPIFYYYGISGFVRMKRQSNRNIVVGLICMFVPYLYLIM